MRFSDDVKACPRELGVVKRIIIKVAPLSVCTKEEQRSVIRFLWSEDASGTRNPSKTFGTIWEQCIAATECLTNGLKKLKNGRTNVIHDKGAERPSTAITEDNIERARDMVLLDEWLLMKWHMFCKIAMIRPTKLYTTNLGFINSVQDGSQNNSQSCISTCGGHLPKTFGSLW